MVIETAKIIEIFRSEVLQTAKSYYTWKHLNNIAARDPAILRAMRGNALTWTTIQGSLQTGFLISLGRIFDANPKSLTVDSLLASCKGHIADFDADALAARKIAGNHGVKPDWLDDYMTKVYSPTQADFDAIAATVVEHRDKYNNAIKPIRHKFIAHRDIASIKNSDKIFGGATIGDVEDMLLALYRVYGAVNEFFLNGNKLQLDSFHLRESEEVEADLRGLLTKVVAGAGDA
jgi:hypothetical protein